MALLGRRWPAISTTSCTLSCTTSIFLAFQWSVRVSPESVCVVSREHRGMANWAEKRDVQLTPSASLLRGLGYRSIPRPGDALHMAQPGRLVFRPSETRATQFAMRSPLSLNGTGGIVRRFTPPGERDRLGRRPRRPNVDGPLLGCWALDCPAFAA